MTTPLPIALVLLLASLGAPVAQATTITVDSAADDMSVNGTCTLRKAIEAANTDTAIDACPAGTTSDRIVFDASLAGATIALTLGELVLDSPITLDGADRNITIDAGGASRVLYASSSGFAEVSGLTLTGGQADDGGGLYIENTSTLMDVVIQGNHATNRGGGLFYNGLGTLVAEGLTVRGNTAAEGGGIYTNSPLGFNLLQSTVSDNVATSGGGVFNADRMTIEESTIASNHADTGGGIFSSSRLTTLVRTELRSNVAESSGGGLYVQTGSSSIDESVVAGNEAVDGGGVYNVNGTTTLTQGEVRANVAEGNGGGIYNLRGDIAITESTIAANQAVDGGGVYSGSSSASDQTIERTLLRGNTAEGNGGGLFLAGFVSLTQNTIAGNTANQSGGGLFLGATTTDPAIMQTTVIGNEAPQGGGLFLSETSSVQLGGTIVSGNTGSSGHGDLEQDVGATIISDGYNLIGDTNATASFNQPGDLVGIVDPVLGPLTNNGGATGTTLPLLGSPVIDASAPVVCGSLTTDQRGDGFPRVIDGDGNGTAVCDIGAVEAPVPPCEHVVTNTADDGAVGALRYEIGCADPGTTITFDAALDGQTIALNGTQLALTKDLTLDAEGQDVTVQQTGAERVLVVSADATVDLVGLTLTGGLVSGDGGAILNEGTLRLTDITLRDNRAEQGGGVFNRGTLALTSTTLEGNMASSNGGGIFNEGLATLAGSIVMGSRADQNGGGLLNDGSMALTEMEIHDNEAAFGGGILNFSGDLTLTASTVRDNVVGQDGGGVFIGGGAASVVRSTVSGNRAGVDGGGILLRGLTSMKQASVTQQSFLVLEQATVAENTAGNAGGGLLVGEEASVVQSTISANQAQITGGAFVEGGSTLELGGTIVSGNTSPNASADVHVLQQGLVTSLGYNLIGQTNTGVFIEPGDRDGVSNPGLTPRADNGGPTATMALQSGSPALDGSDKSICGDFGTDQRGSGFARERDGNSDGTPVCDVGAYEAAPSSSVTPMLTVLYTSPPGFSMAQVQSTLQGSSAEALFDATGDGVPELVLLSVDAQGQPQEVRITDGLSNTLLVAYDAQQILAATGTGEAPFVGFFEVDGDTGLETLFAVDGAILFDDTQGEEQIYFTTSSDQRFAGVVDLNADGRADLVLYDTARQVVQIIGWVGGTASARAAR